MLFQDSRFTTLNTNLASCLGALRIPLKQVVHPGNGETYADHVRVVEDSETGKKVVYWCFEDEGQDREGNKIEARVIESHWRNRETFELENPEHPLVSMRKALEKLEWVTKVWHGNIKVSPRPGTPIISTTNANMAACLLAAGNELLCFENYTFRFGYVLPEVLDAYANFRRIKHPIAQMRLVLEVRSLLIKELRRPDLRVQIHYKNGDPLNGGRELFLMDGSSPSDVELLINALYE